MHVKGITDEDFLNYKHPSMYICTSSCDFKCDKENGVSCCQNSSLAKQDTIFIADEAIINRYMNNPITKSIVIAGLEPFEQFSEVFNFIYKLRYDYHCNDTVVIYTGYNESEIEQELNTLKTMHNIIIKFGRFVPNQSKHYDEILGIYLASHNQYAVKIS